MESMSPVRKAPLHHMGVTPGANGHPIVFISIQRLVARLRGPPAHVSLFSLENLDNQCINLGDLRATQVERGACDARSHAGQGRPPGRLLLQQHYFGVRPRRQVAASAGPAFGDGTGRLHGAAGPVQLQRCHQRRGQRRTVSGKRRERLAYK